jgi:hypothetical protein
MYGEIPGVKFIPLSYHGQKNQSLTAIRQNACNGNIAPAAPYLSTGLKESLG